MKLDRLIGILSILLQREQATTSELAGQFEVSRRTIQRDLDALARAGIPLASRKGTGGGVSILPGYKFDRTVLTAPERQEILAGLRSLASVDNSNRCVCLMEKLEAGSTALLPGGASVLIDLSAWDKATLAPKIEQIRRCIDQGRKLAFRYYAPNGESVRCIEPYALVFHWSSWYVWGWCGQRQDYRLFKLNRMEGLRESEAAFARRAAPLPDLRSERVFPGGIPVRAQFEPGCKWRLIEEFGPSCFEQQPDGSLLFHAEFTDRQSLLSWLLTFGAQAELLEPQELRAELQQIGETLCARYAPPAETRDEPKGGT